MMRLLERDLAPLFNGALAAVTAIAAAFATYAMPNDVFSGLVAATGLPSLVPAAEPPLGLTARLAAMAAVSTLAFLIVWFILGAIDAADEDYEDEEDGVVDNEEAEDVAEGAWELQRRIRRADAHPDAPPRQPLLAKRELGEPADDVDSEVEPDWMNPQPLAAGSEIVEDPWTTGTADRDPSVEIASVEQAPVIQDSLQEPPAAETLELASTAKLPSGEEHDPRDPRSWFEPAPPVDKMEAASEAHELPPETVAEPDAESPAVWPLAEQGEAPFELNSAPAEQDVETTAQDEPATTEALMARLPLPEDRGESISTLFQRLDAGLANVEWPLAQEQEPEASAGEADDRQSDDPNSVSHQLRDALGDLQRMASRRS